jgi:hypothetical protein
MRGTFPTLKVDFPSEAKEDLAALVKSGMPSFAVQDFVGCRTPIYVSIGWQADAAQQILVPRIGTEAGESRVDSE